MQLNDALDCEIQFLRGGGRPFRGGGPRHGGGSGQGKLGGRQGGRKREMKGSCLEGRQERGRVDPSRINILKCFCQFEFVCFVGRSQ